MDDRRAEEPASQPGAVSRDLPDQQAQGPGEQDRWDPDDATVRESGAGEDGELPDTDEAGTRRRDAEPATPGTEAVEDQVGPEESSG